MEDERCKLSLFAIGHVITLILIEKMEYVLNVSAVAWSRRNGTFIVPAKGKKCNVAINNKETVKYCWN